MHRVHFIAIGGADMHNLAIAISKKQNFLITGSDISISERVRTRLKKNNLLPEKEGWFTDNIHKGLSAVIIGGNVTEENPELLRARELKLKIFSLPEYLYLQTRSKTRIVVGGSYGKTIITAIILFILKKLKIDADYMINSEIEGFENSIKLTYESRIAVFEGDENSTSIIDNRPFLFHYKPHIAILTGIAYEQNKRFSSFEEYIDQFHEFTNLMEVQGRLIYFVEDENLKKNAIKLRRDIVPFEYNTPAFEVVEGVTLLKTRNAKIPIKITGEHNLQNIEAARMACKQIGVTDVQFYTNISEFPGIFNRL